MTLNHMSFSYLAVLAASAARVRPARDTFESAHGGITEGIRPPQPGDWAHHGALRNLQGTTASWRVIRLLLGLWEWWEHIESIEKAAVMRIRLTGMLLLWWLIWVLV